MNSGAEVGDPGTKEAMPSPLDPVKIGQKEIQILCFLALHFFRFLDQLLMRISACESLLFTTVKKEQSHERLFPN